MGHLSAVSTYPGLPLPTLLPLDTLFQPFWQPKLEDRTALTPLAPLVLRPSNPADQLKVSAQGNTQTSVAFVEQADQPADLPTALADIRKVNAPAERAEKFADLLADLIEDKDFEGAMQLFRAVLGDRALPLDQRNQMYKVLTRSLLEADLHDKAIELNACFPNPKIKDEVRQDIVEYLIEEGQTIKAAQVKGEGNVGGVIKVELESLGKSARTLGKDIYELWRRSVFGVSLGERIAENALDDAEAGKKYRHKWLDYGNLACAYTISRVLDRTRLDDAVDSAECNTLAAQLKKSGFSQVAGDARMKPVGKVDYKPGDIVFFTRKNKAGYGHVGIIARVEGDKVWMVHNSSPRRQVVQVQLNTYQRPVVGVLRPPAK